MYNLIEKTYKDEVYSHPHKYNSTIIIKMHYHTIKHYWDVGVYFTYPPHFRIPYVEGNEYIKTRKEARKVAQDHMKVNPNTYWDRLSDFHKEKIIQATQ